MTDMHLALHGLAIKKHGSPAEVAALMGLAEARVAALLDEAATRGRAARAGAKYMLTAPAQIALKGEYGKLYGALRSNPEMMAAYDAFEVVNAQLKALITDWQTVEVAGSRVPNTHADKAHDARIIDRLGTLHEGAERVIARMAAHLPRLKVYAQLLTEALERAEDGAHEWVSDARLPSYHTVWFELHEDLLRILGRVRDE
ncbi:MAG: hypothetical protein ACK4OP_07625 [Gemmobacter sp.]